MRELGQKTNDVNRMAWAGQAAALAREEPAAEFVHRVLEAPSNSCRGVRAATRERMAAALGEAVRNQAPCQKRPTGQRDSVSCSSACLSFRETVSVASGGIAAECLRHCLKRLRGRSPTAANCSGSATEQRLNATWRLSRAPSPGTRSSAPSSSKWPARIARLWRCLTGLGVPTVASCAARFQVELDNEDIDDADRIVLRHVFVQAGGKQCRLRAILALDDISSTGIEAMRTNFFLARVSSDVQAGVATGLS